MKLRLTTGWHLMRMLRILMGIAGLIYAVMNRDTLLGAVGLFLLLTGIFNVGCCGAGACTVPKQDDTK